MKEWKVAVFFEDNEMEFTENIKRVKLEMPAGGYMLVKLEKVGEWNNEEIIHYVIKEVDVSSRKAVSKIHRTLIHTKIEQMEFASRNAGGLDVSLQG